MALQSRVIPEAVNTADRARTCSGLLDAISSGKLDIGAEDEQVLELLHRRASVEREQPN